MYHTDDICLPTNTYVSPPVMKEQKREKELVLQVSIIQTSGKPKELFSY